MSLPIGLLPRFGRALVVGGGGVAERKVAGLVEAGFAVTVVAPRVNSAIRGRVAEIRARPFEPGDLEGHAIVFACTDDRRVNRAVGEAARARGLPVLVADSQAESTFFTPAVHRDGDLVVAVSTGGASPRLAAELRDRVARALGEGWAHAVAVARAKREVGLEKESGP
jgi:precorrin-2 dehydrogenase/sirohydrochlorin ferrochelatase